MKPCFVGFDTSNYTTSVAACDADGNIIANLKAPLCVKYGECGLRQSDAVFEHVRNLPALTYRLQEITKDYAPLAVGVSATPRRAADSYMPCFLSGKSAAHAYAAGAGVKTFEFSHQEGHIMAALHSAGRLDLLCGGGFFAFHVSGGTTEVLLVSAKRDGFDVQIVGKTADISAGQAIDRVGVMLGLKFPCGASLEALASEYEGALPSKSVCARDGVCSLSGLENMAANMYGQEHDEKKVAAFVFDFILRTIEKMADDVAKKYGNLPMIFAGGVMSNKIMRKALRSRFDAFFAEPQYSADNAAGIALLCKKRYEEINGYSEGADGYTTE